MEDREEFGFDDLPDSAANSTSEFFAREDSRFTKQDFKLALKKVSRQTEKPKPSLKSS